MRNTSGSDFFAHDPVGTEREMNSADDRVLRPNHANDCVRLARNIAALVREQDAQPATGVEAAPPASKRSRPVAYAVEYSMNRHEDRPALRTELQMGGYQVIPEGQNLVPCLTRDEIRAAITSPVHVACTLISPRLLTRLLNLVGDNPDQLSIL